MNPPPEPSEQPVAKPALQVRFRLRWWLIGFALLALLIAFAPIQTIIWDGRFSDEEYQLKFNRPDGTPVSGVKLRVETRAGGVSYLYPINEFLPDDTPISDATGRMVYHHVSHGLEFGGRDYRNLVGITLSRAGAPQFDCVFLVDGREIHRLRFDDLRLRGEGDNAPRVVRTWQPTDWPAREYIAHHERWGELEMELFDGNGDGQLDREERTARGYFDRAAMYAVEFKDHPAAKPCDIEFAVRERTIVIDVP